jgi:hypothetical protein
LKPFFQVILRFPLTELILVEVTQDTVQTKKHDNVFDKKVPLVVVKCNES